MKYEAKPHLSADQQAQMYNISGRKQSWSISWREPLRFIRYHYLKLFKMMIVGFIAFTMIDYITPGPRHYEVLGIVSMLGMFNNCIAKSRQHHLARTLLVLRSDAAALHRISTAALSPPLGMDGRI